MYVDCFLYFGRHLSSSLVRWQRGRLKRFYGVFGVLGNAVLFFIRYVYFNTLHCMRQLTLGGFVILKKPNNFLCGLPLSVFEVFTEIDGADLFVVDQVVGLAGGEDSTVADDVGSVADAEGFAYVVVGNEYADAARFEEVDDFLDVDDGNGVDAGEGFVQEDEARLHGEYAGDFDASAFAAG